VAAMTSDTARQLLGGDINGHDVVAGHANRNGLTLLTTPHRWQWRPRERRERREARPGSRLIGTGGVLLFLLGLGLLAVSFAAQYQYVLHERHQHVASLIEAGALDVGLIIFSLLALGLARAGLSAKIERAAVIGCAIGSAVMNYAAADVTSPRSVLAYCMPPVFLAFVVDRVVRTIQRHVLGMAEALSPWSVLADTARRITRFWLLSVLYSLRFVIDRRGTWSGVKQAVINATPLPQAPAPQPLPVTASARCPVPLAPDGEPCAKSRPCSDHPDGAVWPTNGPMVKVSRRALAAYERSGSKKAALLNLYRQHEGYGDRSRVSRIAAELAPLAGLQAGTARTYLGEAVRQIGSDSK
jgi:hypothetical protein